MFSKKSVNENIQLKISVLIIAYNRREYLVHSLYSAYAQTLSRDRYEIIVIKNFEDPYLDNMISYFGARSILIEDGCSLSKACEVGIKAATGDIISFLEDDDVYKNTKLEEVLTIFSSDPNIGFFRHNVSFINSQGKSIRKKERENLRITFDRNLIIKNVKKYLWLLRYSGAAFNISSMSIKKSLFAPFLDNFGEAFGLCSDGAMLSLALTSHCTIHLSRKYLGLYRKSPQSASRSIGTSLEAKNKTAQIVNRFYDDVEAVSKFYNDQNVSVFMYYQTMQGTVNAAINVMKGKSLPTKTSDAFDLKKVIKAGLLARDPLIIYDVGRYFFNRFILHSIPHRIVRAAQSLN